MILISVHPVTEHEATNAIAQVIESGKAGAILTIGLPLLGALATILFTGLFFGLETSAGLESNVLDATCSANGDFHLHYYQGPFLYDIDLFVHPTRLGDRILPASSTALTSQYNPYWQSSQFLSITLGFGHFPYALAKGIDICWDLLVGRIGQVLLTLTAYPIIRRSLFSHMERVPIRVPLHASMAFDKMSFHALQDLLLDIFRQSRSRKPAYPVPIWRYAGFSYIIAYILFVPTLVSIMTGYQTDWIPYFQRPDNQNLVEFAQLETPQLVVFDGNRVSLDESVLFKGDDNYETLLAYGGTQFGYQMFFKNRDADFDAFDNSLCFRTSYFNTEAFNSSLTDSFSDWERNPNCNLTWDAHAGRFTSSQITLDGKTWQLDDPPLYVAVQTGWIISEGFNIMTYLSLDGMSLWWSTLQLFGSCQPASHYIWGFSSILLFIFSISSVCFAAILALLYYESIWTGSIGTAKYEVNVYRDAVDLVYDLQDNYFGDELRDMSAEDIKKQCANKGISIESSELSLSWREQKRASHPSAKRSTTSRLGGVTKKAQHWANITVQLIKNPFSENEEQDDTQIKPLRSKSAQISVQETQTD